MTQQLDPTFRPCPDLDATVDGTPAPGMAFPAQAPGVAPPGGWAPPSPPQGFGPMPTAMPAGWDPRFAPVPPAPPVAPRSTGRLIAILVGGGTAALVAVVAVVALLAGVFATSAPAPAPVPASPSVSAPAPSVAPSPAVDPGQDRHATQQTFDAAGVRLDRARAAFDQRLDAAAKRGDIAGFRAAARDFSSELATYRATVTGLTMPVDQQAAFSGTLLPALDATTADAADMAKASGWNQLTAAAGRFDQHWGVVVSTHNQMDDALNVG